MEKYAPTIKDLASRDVVSRAIFLEVRDGNGVNGKNYVHLDVTPATVNKYFEQAGEKRRLTREDIEQKLPDIADFTRTYLGVDPVEEPMPVQPTAHYAMGGIPTDVDARVLADAQGNVITGLYAAGEVACVSVHGANRLGTNSLVDLVVFGRRAGMHIADNVHHMELPPLPENAAAEVMAEFERIRTNSGKAKPYELRNRMQKTMTANVGVFRTEDSMTTAMDELKQLRQEYMNDITIDDKGKLFNTDLLEAWELGCLLELAEITAFSARNRKESRGGHAREDFPKRNDQDWLKHTFCHKEGEHTFRLDYKPVTILRYQPKERVY